MKNIKPHTLHKSANKLRKKNAPDYFFGVHAVRNLLQTRPSDVKTLFVQIGNDGHTLHDDICQMATDFGISIQKVHKDNLNKLCAHNHQGIIADALPIKPVDEHALIGLCQKPDALFLVLDQITDAHNLGACLRTAAAMGVDAVILPKNQSAKLSSVVAKVAVGATEMIPIVSATNLARTLQKLKDLGVFVFGTALQEDAKPLSACNFLGKVAIIMGSEGSGMRRLTMQHCDHIVYIPMTMRQNRPQSLNVSVATGMVLYEVCRARGEA